MLTVYDALNDNRNIESSVRSGHEAGMKVNAMMTYTLSPVHDDAYYVETHATSWWRSPPTSFQSRIPPGC